MGRPEKFHEARQRVAKVPDRPEYMPMELHLPDEERSWMLYWDDFPCPRCGYTRMKMLRRTGIIMFDPFRTYQKFSIHCYSETCGFHGPEMTSSEAATKHWKLYATLSR